MKIRKIGRWLAKGRWVAIFIAHLLATAALWVRIQTSIKKNTKLGDISKGVANTLSAAKKYLEKEKEKKARRTKLHRLDKKSEAGEKVHLRVNHNFF